MRLKLRFFIIQFLIVEKKININLFFVNNLIKNSIRAIKSYKVNYISFRKLQDMFVVFIDRKRPYRPKNNV